MLDTISVSTEYVAYCLHVFQFTRRIDVFVLLISLCDNVKENDVTGK